VSDAEVPVQFGEGEFIDFAPPDGLIIIPWSISLALVMAGIIGSLFGYITFNEGLAIFSTIIVILCSIFIILITPSKLQKELKRIKKINRPRDFVIISEDKGSQSNFWTGHQIERPESDDRGWLFDAPGPEYWNQEDKYCSDDNGIIAEHPTQIGTPTPATISAFGIFSGIIALYALPTSYYLVFWGLTEPIEGDIETLAGKIVLILGPLISSIGWLISSRTTGKRMQQTVDIPTSKIRSLAAGELELVGQVREWTSPAPTVYVGGDESRIAENLHLWRWLYEIYIERREYYIQDGKPKTRVVREWRVVGDKNGSHPFILHDGTGGVLVRPNTFDVVNLGQFITRWTVPHMKNIQSLFGSIIKTALSGERTLKHRWTLWGMALGDPCYILGKATNRLNKEMSEEKFLSKPQNRLMEISGREAPQFEPRLERGSELGVMSKVRSQFEYNIIPVITAAGVVAGTILAMLIV